MALLRRWPRCIPPGLTPTWDPQRCGNLHSRGSARARSGPAIMFFLDVRGVAVLLVALVAIASDVRTRRIPNWLTFGAAAAALVYAAYNGGVQGVGIAAAGWLAGAALFFPFFALGGMGAG